MMATKTKRNRLTFKSSSLMNKTLNHSCNSTLMSSSNYRSSTATGKHFKELNRLIPRWSKLNHTIVLTSELLILQ